MSTMGDAINRAIAKRQQQVTSSPPSADDKARIEAEKQKAHELAKRKLGY